MFRSKEAFLSLHGRKSEHFFLKVTLVIEVIDTSYSKSCDKLVKKVEKA